MSKEIYISLKRELYISQKRPICEWAQKRPMWVPVRIATASQETNTHVKKDLYTCQKRPVWHSKETYICVIQKRLTYVALKRNSSV